MMTSKVDLCHFDDQDLCAWVQDRVEKKMGSTKGRDATIYSEAASQLIEADWFYLRKTVTENVALNDLTRSERSEREIAVQRYLRAQPQTESFGVTYDAPWTFKLQDDALDARRNLMGGEKPLPSWYHPDAPMAALLERKRAWDLGVPVESLPVHQYASSGGKPKTIVEVLDDEMERKA